jgi:gamma-glutamyl hydrolase
MCGAGQATNVVLLLVLVSFPTFNFALNARPIIGVLTQPTSSEYHPEKKNHSYLTASYVKFIEMSGARVVPIQFNASREELLRLFKSVNGLFFTGGMLDMKNGTSYFDNSLYLYNLALEANRNGDYFPVWGTCQGFQLFHVFAAELPDENLLMEHFDSWNISYPLVFDLKNVHSSKMMGFKSGISDIILHDFASLPITMNFHHLGVSRGTYEKHAKIKNFFNILSTNKDRKGVEFVSIVEAKNYPIFAVQFHPEWPIFEWEPTAQVSHTEAAVRANSYFSSFFVNECRKNDHKFATPKEEQAALIYNWSPEFTEASVGDIQTYFWKI